MKYKTQECHVVVDVYVEGAQHHVEVQDMVQVEVQVDVHYNTRRTKSQDQSRATRSVRDDVEIECTK